jgi:K+-sensing histidine kinase KdpD
VTLVPVWRIAQNASKAIADTARAMGVTAVMLGVSQRSAIYHMLRGNVLKGLARRLPEERIKIITVG